MATPATDKDSLFETIDKEALDERERQDSKILYEALLQRKGELGAASELPDDDDELSSRIHREAERRSQELSSRGRHSSSLVPEGGRPVPRWLWLLWLAVAAIAALVWYLIAG